MQKLKQMIKDIFNFIVMGLMILFISGIDSIADYILNPILAIN
jgi:hypothetical protein